MSSPLHHFIGSRESASTSVSDKMGRVQHLTLARMSSSTCSRVIDLPASRRDGFRIRHNIGEQNFLAQRPDDQLGNLFVCPELPSGLFSASQSAGRVRSSIFAVPSASCFEFVNLAASWLSAFAGFIALVWASVPGYTGFATLGAGE